MIADPTALSWPLLALAVFSSILLARQGGRPWRLSRPSTLIGFMSAVMVTCGTWSYYATREFFPEFYVPINTALIYAALGIAIAALFSAMMRRIPSRASTFWRWDLRTLDRLVLIYVVLAVVGTIGSLARIGYIPLLRGDIREERLLYADIAGVFFRLSLLGASAAVLAGIRWMRFGRTKVSVATVPIGLVATALYGPRFFPFVVLGILFLCYDTYVRRVRIVRAVVSLTIVVALGVTAALHRESSGTFVFDQGVGSIDAKTALNAVGYVSVPEFRDFAWSLDYFAEERHRLGGETLAGASTALLPSAVWKVVGVDKDALYSRDAGTIMAEILGQDTGIRIGILGELFMNFGLTGIIVGMAIFGAFVGWQDRRLAAGSLSDPFTPFLALVTVVSMFALVGILHMFVSAVVLFGWPLMLAVFIAGRRTTAPAGPAYSSDFGDVRR